jgi:hypothetical protein
VEQPHHHQRSDRSAARGNTYAGPTDASPDICPARVAANGMPLTRWYAASSSDASHCTHYTVVDQHSKGADNYDADRSQRRADKGCVEAQKLHPSQHWPQRPSHTATHAPGPSPSGCLATLRTTTRYRRTPANTAPCHSRGAGECNDGGKALTSLSKRSMSFVSCRPFRGTTVSVSGPLSGSPAALAGRAGSGRPRGSRDSITTAAVDASSSCDTHTHAHAHHVHIDRHMAQQERAM